MTEPMIKKIIVVYNADSGLFNSLSDFAHKIISPQTYQCNLCLITHGHLGMKTDWRQFLDSLPYEKIFFHKNEFYQRYPQFKSVKLPAIFILSNDNPQELASAEEINAKKDIEGLKDIVHKKITNLKILP